MFPSYYYQNFLKVFLTKGCAQNIVFKQSLTILFMNYLLTFIWLPAGALIA